MSTHTHSTGFARNVAAAAVFAAVVAGVAVIGSLAADRAGNTYMLLQQPSWAPPSWLFGPVWTILYVLIAIAGWLVWHQAGSVAAARTELSLYATQLLLNMIWTPIFFAAGLYGIALLDILLLDVILVATVITFLRRYKLAAALLVPYLGWTLFATALNTAIWLLNS